MSAGRLGALTASIAAIRAVNRTCAFHFLRFAARCAGMRADLVAAFGIQASTDLEEPMPVELLAQRLLIATASATQQNLNTADTIGVLVRIRMRAFLVPILLASRRHGGKDCLLAIMHVRIRPNSGLSRSHL